MCDLHQQEQATEENGPTGPYLPTTEHPNSQSVGITPHSLSLVDWVVEAWSLLTGFINGEGGDDSAVLPAIYIKSVQKEGEKLWTSGYTPSQYRIPLPCWHEPVSMAWLNNSLN